MGTDIGEVVRALTSLWVEMGWIVWEMAGSMPHEGDDEEHYDQ